MAGTPEERLTRLEALLDRLEGRLDERQAKVDELEQRVADQESRPPPAPAAGDELVVPRRPRRPPGPRPEDLAGGDVGGRPL